jgi:hypothetical protein
MMTRFANPRTDFPTDAMRHFTRTLMILPLLAASLAMAADKPAKKEGGFGGAKGAYLTRDELRVCLNRQNKVKTEDAEMLKEKAEITGVKDELVRSGDELKQRLETVDRTVPEAVSAYNEALAARDARVDAYQKRVDAFNARVLANQSEREAFGTACNNRRYFDEDEQAIRRGK